MADLATELAGSSVWAIALDLPGIGGSQSDPTDGSKHHLGEVLHDVLEQLEISNFVLVGHDIGGMITYSYIHRYDDVARGDLGRRYSRRRPVG